MTPAEKKGTQVFSSGGEGKEKKGTQVFFSVLLWPVAHPWGAVVVAVLMGLLSVGSAFRLHPDTSLEAMFSKNDPSAAALGHVLNDFPAADQLLVLATLPQRDVQPDPQRLVAFAERFVGRVHQDPALERLTDGVFFQPDAESHAFVEKVIGPAAIYYLDDDAFAAARKRLTREEINAQIAQDKTLLATPGPAAQALSKMIAQDPLRLHEFILDRLAGQRPFRTYENVDAFVSPDGRGILIRVIGREPPNNLAFCRELTAGVARAAESANADGLTLEYAGSYPIATLSERSIRHDMIESVVGSVILLQLLFVVAYRNPFRLFALAFGPVALGILLGFGVFATFSPALTPVTAVLGAILAGMGIDYSIQYLAYYEARRAEGLSKQDAARDAAVRMSPGVLAAWLTSAVGFVAIGASHVKALRDFAILGTLGLTGAFVCAVMLMPALLMLTDGRNDARPTSRTRFGIGPLASVLASRHRLWVVLSLGLFAAASLVMIRAGGEILPLETDLAVMHPHPNPAIDAQYHIAKRFGISLDTLTVYLRAGSPDELVSLSYDVSRRLKNPAAREAGVLSTLGLSTLLPDPRVIATRQSATGPAEAERVVTDFRAALEANGFAAKPFEPYAKFLHMLLTQKRVPTVDELVAYRRVAEAVLPAAAFRGAPATEAITLVFMNNALDQDRASRDASIDAVRSALGGVPGATVTGLGVAGHDTEQTVRRELPRLILIACAIIAVYHALHFRSLGDAFLSLVPAGFGMVVTAAALRLAGQKLNMINLVAIPMLIGIDVDYGIFLINLARVKRAREQSAAELTRTIEPAGHAVVMCAVATFLGYVSLVWTSIPAERSLGVAASVGVACCLIGVMFLLIPVLFSLCRRP